MPNCEHGKRKSRCKECGGSELCTHDKIKYNCKDCNGSLFCEHGNRKPQCKECGGCSICEHNVRKSYCKICNGAEICIHNKRKSRCPECNGSELCEHKRYKSTCKECDGGSICIHDRIRTSCKECLGGSICEHNKRRIQCLDCNGSQFCIHKIYKYICKICHGSQICDHNNIKSKCIECGGASICIHNILKRRCKTCDGKDLCKTPLCETRKSTKFDDYCLYCYVNLFPEKPLTRNYKTKEFATVKYIKDFFPKFDWTTNKVIIDGCSNKKPDLLLDLGYQIIVIEVDENQHRGYGTSCENKRLMELSKDVDERPIIFIRFNTDNYFNEDGIKISSCWGNNKKGMCIIKDTKKKEWNERLKVLSDNIQYWTNPTNTSSITIKLVHLFYDVQPINDEK